MTVQFEIRDATLADVEPMTVIQNALLASHTVEWTERTASFPERVAWFRERVSAGRAVLVAVAPSQDVIGWAAYGDFRSRPGYRLTAELTIHVDRDHWRSGAGRGLLRALIERARADGLHVLVAGIDGENRASVALHRELGFVEVARMPEVGTKFGRWLDLIFMQLPLDDHAAPPGGVITSPDPRAALVGRHVRLEPCRLDHADELVEAANADRSTFGFTEVPDSLPAMQDSIGALLAAESRGAAMPYTHCRAVDGRAIGMTRFLNPRRTDSDGALCAVEIGGTWLAASAQRTAVNREAKLLMLTHAFEHWGVTRVDLKTDARNERSRRGIEGIGATFEGVLRAWQPSLVIGEEGQFRDTAMYSIVAEEWPSIRTALTAALDR